MSHKTTLLMNGFVTHDVRRFLLQKPDGFAFTPGQGVELAIDEDPWKDETRPFTPTSLGEDRVLEFIIKAYSEHDGVTEALRTRKPGTAITIGEPFGTIEYKGPGVFIAGGAGITPFIAILRDLAVRGDIKEQRLIFSNKTPADIILEKELRHLLGDRCRFTCTQSSAPGYDDRRIDTKYLDEQIDDFDQRFYVCGPPSFMESITKSLKSLGADPDALVFED